MLSPLARDPHGSPFDLPTEAAFWRVRRHTGGRPSTVLGPDGEPLFVAVGADRQELRAYGCNGSLRLEAVDTDYRPVQAPVAFVELGAPEDTSARTVEAPTGGHELLRASVESLTHTMAAMQRAQVERERALAQKERAVTDAQVAMQKSHTELMVALLERATNKPQDALAVVKQQMAVDQILEERAGAIRNGGALPAVTVPVAADSTSTLTRWAGAILPLAPMVADVISKTMAKNDEAKAADIRRNVGVVADAVGGVIQQVEGAEAIQPVATMEPEPARLMPSKAMRQVLALLDDTESEALLDHLYDISDAEEEAIERQAEAIADVSTRVAWARALIRSLDDMAEAESHSERTRVSSAAPVNGTFSVPPALFPVLAQLSADEQVVGSQILHALDRATVEKFTARLLAMTQQEALAAIRDAIAEAQRRSASVAQRAVASVLNADGGDA